MQSEKKQLEFLKSYYELFSGSNDNVNDFIGACEDLIAADRISRETFTKFISSVSLLEIIKEKKKEVQELKVKYQNLSSEINKLEIKVKELLNGTLINTNSILRSGTNSSDPCSSGRMSSVRISSPC